ncbi:hypothetical protein C0992_007159 [Termitomyces sp. T32_za158]|nr:hypothetical protein C0992_007159 [Termitomyces sp. T32_za158]
MPRLPIDSHMVPTADLEQNQAGAQGTFFQEQLGIKSTRKYFFAPVDLAHAEAVYRDAEKVEYSDEDEVSLLEIPANSESELFYSLGTSNAIRSLAKAYRGQ